MLTEDDFDNEFIRMSEAYWKLMDREPDHEFLSWVPNDIGNILEIDTLYERCSENIPSNLSRIPEQVYKFIQVSAMRNYADLLEATNRGEKLYSSWPRQSN